MILNCDALGLIYLLLFKKIYNYDTQIGFLSRIIILKYQNHRICFVCNQAIWGHGHMN